MKRRASSASLPQKDPLHWLPWLPAVLFFLLPFVVSVAGLDKFRFPKDVFLLGSCTALAAAFLVTRRLQFLKLRNLWNLGLLLTLLFTTLHVLVLGRSAVSLPALVDVVSLVMLMLILTEILDGRSQQNIWLLAGISLSINSLLTIAQYFGAFPLMENAAGGILSGRLNPAGLIGEVNSGGFLFALIALIALGALFSETVRWRQLLWGSVLASNLLGLIFTRTLTAIAGFALCLGLWLIWEHWRTLMRKQRSLRWLLILWSLIIAGGAGAAVVASRAGLTDRIVTVAGQVARGNLEGATAGRQQLFRITWRMIRERPILGRGLHTFGQDFFTFRVSNQASQTERLLTQSGAFRQAHNEYLQTWEELGIVGLLLWLGLFVSLGWQGLRAALNCTDEVTSCWRFHLWLGLVLLAFTSLTFFPFHVGVTAAFAVLLIASLRAGIVNPEPAPPAWMAWQERVPRGVFLGAGFLLIAFTIWSSLGKWGANVNAGHAAELLEVARQQPAGRTRTVMVRQALARLQEARKRDPTLFEVDNLEGTAHFLLGRFDESIAHYRVAAEYLPSPEVYTNLAAALMSVRENEEARRRLQEALRYNPRYEPAKLALDTLGSGS